MLLDTSGFFSLHDKAAKHNALAVEIYQKSHLRLTTNYVLAEYTALALIRRMRQEKVIAFSESVLSDETIEIVWVDEDLHTKAVELLKNRQDKTYSLCDAVSFVVMRERGIAEALTTDGHFAQESFIQLLK
jgi:predicted nucleic acid-binding protein